MSTAPPQPLPSDHRLAFGLLAAVVVVWAVLLGGALRTAALDEGESGMVLAVFPPGTPDTEVFQAVVRAGGEPVRRTWVSFAWVAQGQAAGFVGRLHREGAWAAYGEIPVAGPALGGCMVVSADQRKTAEFRLRP